VETSTLHCFLTRGEGIMILTLWENMSSDNRRDFIAYLNKICHLRWYDNPKQQRQKEVIRDLIIPTLVEGDGWIPEDMDRIQDLAQRWDMTNGQLIDRITQLWRNMHTPLDAKQAGKLIRKTAGTLRRWARQEKIPARVDKRGHWIFSREFLVDHMR